MNAPETPFVDANERTRAITVLDRPILVEAGAGTGKTTLLVARVVHAIAAGRLAMGRLVAISFTEKAAAELRFRIRRALERGAADAERPEPERARLARALLEIDRARISTIHAFAAGILREHPVQTGLDPRCRVLDELESVRFFREFWDRWIEARLDEDGLEPLRDLLLAGIRIEPDLFEFGRELELQRDVIDQLRVPRPHRSLTSMLQRLRNEMLACARHAEQHCRNPADEGLLKLRALAATMEPLERMQPSSWPAVFLGKLALGVNAGRKDDWAAGMSAANKALRRTLRTELEAAQRAIADTLLHAACGLMGSFQSEYTAEKRRRGVLDFQDLLVEARLLVQQHPDVRRELGSRIDMLCVDEFQDTDPLQAELVLFLAEANPGAAASWTDVEVGAKLFLVGDPKQSIYRFRRADLDVYERCGRAVEAAGGLRLELRQNFRSRPAVLHWVNATFANLFGAESDVASPRAIDLAPTVVPGPKTAVWILRPDPAAMEESGEGWRRAEARAIAAWLRRSIDVGLGVRDDSGVRPLRAGDVALLFARTSGIEHYETALRDAGLGFLQEGGRLFFQRQEVRDVLHALAAIDDPHDEMAIVAALRSPLFGVTDEELWLQRAFPAGFSYLDVPPEAPLAARLGILAELHGARHAHGVAGTIAVLLDRTEARAVLAARALGAQALANVEMLERLARRFESSRPAGLRQFVSAMRDVDDDAPRLAEWTPQDETSDRVRLLTVHAAKGLEFPCVVLANLASAANRHGAPLLVDRLAGRVEARLPASDLDVKIETAGYEEIRVVERRREQAEERRLLYVAATRAQDYLVVPCFHGGKPGGLLEALATVPAALGRGDEPFGDLPVPARGADAAGDEPWCVVEASEQGAADRRSSRLGARIDMRALRLQRAGWPAEHAARLERGTGLDVDAAPCPSDAAEDRSAVESWARLRRLVALALRRASPDDALPQLAAVHGAPELAAELQRACNSWAGSTLASSLQDSTWVGYGIAIAVAAGAGTAEARLDIVIETPAGTTLVELVRAGATAEMEARSRAELAWKTAILERAGTRLAQAGCFFLEERRFVPASELEFEGSTRSD